MNKFDEKIKKMENKLSYIEFYYGNNEKAYRLREKLELYKQAQKMNREEIDETINYIGREIVKQKVYGYDNGITSNDKRLIKALTERIKAENLEKRQKKAACAAVVLCGFPDEYEKGGMEF